MQDPSVAATNGPSFDSENPLKRKLRTRARWLRVASVTILIIIVAALLPAGWNIYSHAGDLTQRDIGYTLERSKFAKARDLRNFYRYLLYEAELKVQSEGGGEFISGVIAKLENWNVDDLPKYPFEKQITEPTNRKQRQLVGEVLSRYNTREKILEEQFLQGQLIGALKAGSKTGAEGDAYILGAIQFTRFGGLTVILFLVAILIRLFRYAMRLAAFYDAPADALLLTERWPEVGRDADLFMRIVAMLTPPASIDFGRLPRTPEERIVDGITQVGKKAATATNRE
jgi:hypothetical protein